MNEERKDPIASAMAHKRWDRLNETQRRKQTEAARQERWKGHVAKPRKNQAGVKQGSQ